MKLNTSSEETALDIKAEGVERGEIRVDGGSKGEVDDKGGLVSGVCVTAEARQISISVCVQTPPTLYLHNQTPTLTFTATPGGDAHFIEGGDPLDKMGRTSLPSQIENSSEDMQEVSEMRREVTGLKTLRNAREKIRRSL
jgi:hypothetical protein